MGGETDMWHMWHTCDIWYRPYDIAPHQLLNLGITQLKNKDMISVKQNILIILILK